MNSSAKMNKMKLKNQRMVNSVAFAFFAVICILKSTQQSEWSTRPFRRWRQVLLHHSMAIYSLPASAQYLQLILQLNHSCGKSCLLVGIKDKENSKKNLVEIWKMPRIILLYSFDIFFNLKICEFYASLSY